MRRRDRHPANVQSPGEPPKPQPRLPEPCGSETATRPERLAGRPVATVGDLPSPPVSPPPDEASSSDRSRPQPPAAADEPPAPPNERRRYAPLSQGGEARLGKRCASPPVS